VKAVPGTTIPAFERNPKAFLGSMFLWVSCKDNIGVNRSFRRSKEFTTGKRM